MEYLWLVVALLAGLFVFGLIGLFIRDNPVTSSDDNSRQIVKHRETYTNEEILMYGVDARSKNARNQIVMSKWAQENGMLPSQQMARFQEQVENRRRINFGPDEVVHGEIVGELEAPRQKRLRG